MLQPQVSPKHRHTDAIFSKEGTNRTVNVDPATFDHYMMTLSSCFPRLFSDGSSFSSESGSE